MLLSNGEYMVPETSGELPNLPSISKKYKTAQICPDNKNATLISMGRLCDDDCMAIMDKHKAVVYKNNTPIIKAPRCLTTGIYLVNLDNPLAMSNAVIKHCSPKIAQIHKFTSLSRLLFLHGAIGSIPISTLRKAIQAGYLTTWPEFDNKAMTKLETPDHTLFGHMDQKRKNTQSAHAQHEALD